MKCNDAFFWYHVVVLPYSMDGLVLWVSPIILYRITHFFMSQSALEILELVAIAN